MLPEARSLIESAPALRRIADRIRRGEPLLRISGAVASVLSFVAAEIVRHGGIAVCAAVSPYRATRNDVRNMVGKDHYVEVFVDTQLEVCEQRDVKGLYAKARRGEIRGFTGIDDPYEPPHHPEIQLDTVNNSPEENARMILDYLQEKGFVRLAEMQE